MGLALDKRRLVLEHAAMRERWGDAPRLRCDPAGLRYWWDLEVRVYGNAFPIRIHYPDSYPAAPPEIESLSELAPNTPHVLPVRRLCWRDPSERMRRLDVWNPAEDTAALAVGVAYRWFLAYLVWRSAGVWPVRDARTS
ncbi:MAG: hypothetical protein HYZ53_07825 [Planctomycetes bacterium]|nr:hypothetical protein [Planctomycetota bacterium]